ncbi:MAG: SDR family NAD(P)-dependent oxidoreductase, partial [Pseudomonadales bacterium]
MATSNPTPPALDVGIRDQVVIVTGATSGLGRACALALGRAGARVVINHRPG